MILHQYYLDCLSHASYLIGDETSGRAVVVDPQRDVAEYVADAEKLGLRIELVIETHFHADFLSGHLELAKATGAKIVYSSVAETEFESMGVADGERYSLGDVILEFRHTPGHTPESLSVVVYEHADDEVPYGVMTGDTLFIGDVGRPDLLASIGFTREELADKLYDSLHDKLMTLPDATRVYPAHGAGSACGKNLSTDLWSTMGDQKATNYALRAPDKTTFMKLVTEGQPPAPGYFVYDAILNRKDRGLLDETKMPAAMTYEQVRAAIDGGAVLVDGRTPEEFAQGHLRHAINIGLEGRYAEFAGSVLAVRRRHRAVHRSRPGTRRQEPARPHRLRPGDRLPGRALSGDVRPSGRRSGRLSADGQGVSTNERRSMTNLQIVDVRNPGEVAAGTIPNAITIPVGQLPARLGELDRHQADSRVLRRRLPVIGRGEPVAAERFHRRQRHPGRLRRLGRSHPERLSDPRRQHIMTTTAKHQILIVGGGTAGITVAARMLRKGYTDVAVIEPSSMHYYQPLWTLVGGGQAKASTTERAESSVMPKDATWIKNAASAVDPDNNTVTCADGTAYEYDVLVVCPGIQLDWNRTEGLEEPLGRDGVSSNYRFDLAPRTWDLIRNTAFWHRGVHRSVRRDQVRGCTAEDRLPGGRLLAKAGRAQGHRRPPRHAGTAALRHPRDRRQPREGHRRLRDQPAHQLRDDLGRRRARARSWITGVGEGGTDTMLPYDVLHAVPRQSAPDWIKSSPAVDRGRSWIRRYRQAHHAACAVPQRLQPSATPARRRTPRPVPRSASRLRSSSTTSTRS